MRSTPIGLLLLLAACSDRGGFVLSTDGGAEGDFGIASSMFATCEREGDEWWASADVTIDPLEVRSVRAILCDPEGTTDAPELPCRVSADVFFSETRARVRCGIGDPTGGGYRYTLVRFVVD